MNSAPVSVSEITKNREKRLQREFKAYAKVLDGVYKRINQCEKMNHSDCLYRVPPFIVGMPIYSHEYAVNYIMNELIYTGQFKAYYLGDSYLYISWGHCMKKIQEKVNGKKKDRHYIRKLVDIPEKKEETINDKLQQLRLQALKYKKN